MNNNYLLRLCIVLLSASCAVDSDAQKILLATGGDPYTIDITSGNCTASAVNVFCLEPGSSSIFSIALYKDTVYYNTPGGALYRAILNKPNSCKLLRTATLSNALTVDKNGIIYWISGATLVRYNPATAEMLSIGNIPFPSAGDLVFYKDKLYLASSGLVEVNIADPAASKMVMPTPGHSFFGLISIPNGCSGSKVYGIESAAPGQSRLVELDIDNLQVLGSLCTIPVSVLDAASITESGIVPGVTIRSVDIQKQCGPSPGGISIKASSAVPDLGFSYTLNGASSNNTGVFTNLAAGSYQISVKSSDGCVTDTTIRIVTADPIDVTLVTRPDTCNMQRGSLTVQKMSGSNTLTFALDNGTEQLVNVFGGIAAGDHILKIKDDNGCQLEQTFAIGSINPPIPLSSISITASCSNSGSIQFSLSSGNVQGVRLDGGAYQTVTEFNNLAAGPHLLQVKTSTCLYDTIIIVPSSAGTAPEVKFVNRSPDCFTSDNGSCTIQVNGAKLPFSVSFNAAAFGQAVQFSNLAPGIYPVKIKDGNGCIWSMSDTIPAYVARPVSVQSTVVHAECSPPSPGRIRLVITGHENPYRFDVKQVRYPSGTEAQALEPAAYRTRIYTAAGCLIDSLDLTVLLQNSSGRSCDTVYVPTAFTPNTDGRNDVLRPVGSLPVTQPFLFRVYNRMGQVVFETRTLGKGWDGRVQGLPQPAGTYLWLVEYTSALAGVKLFKGTTVLIR